MKRHIVTLIIVLTGGLALSALREHAEVTATVAPAPAPPSMGPAEGPEEAGLPLAPVIGERAMANRRVAPGAFNEIEQAKLALAAEAIAAAEAAGTRHAMSASDLPALPATTEEIEKLKLERLRSLPSRPLSSEPGVSTEKGAER